MFTFFNIFPSLSISLKYYELSLYLSTSEEIESRIKNEFNNPMDVSILLFVLHFIFREKRDKSKNKNSIKNIIISIKYCNCFGFDFQ